ncbi:MAG TPA: hypothetical protein VEX41_08875 [Candidatus Eisenbacteria bacterium]|nr:hypothetical protein [Candidatus Eisenbacteria bacterium]
MNHFSTQNLVHDHIDDLLREAEAARLGRLARPVDGVTPSMWRRLLGRGVRGLSFALGVASTRLDPTLDRSGLAERTPLRA